MSLKERVNKAQGANSLQQNKTDEQLFSQLRHYMNERLSSKLLASAKHAPLRVENEIRSLCLEVFSRPDWDEVSSQRKEMLLAQLIDSVFGFGPLSTLLSDASITEIMVNGPDKVFIERAGKIEKAPVRFMDNSQIMGLIDRIVGPLGRRVDESSPMVNARLPQGFRVNAVVEPIAVDGPLLTIRKFPEKILQLEEMAAQGSIEPSLLTFLRWAVLSRKNIAVSGGTGSGKTTFLNALSCFIPENERVITIEDSAELRLSDAAHVVRLEARCANAEGTGQVTIGDLVANALRMRPDRIVVGECRGAEALDMLQAMNTGHAGSLTTLHANSTKEAIGRLVTMVRYSSDVPVEVVESYIAAAMDVVVQTVRNIDGTRFVSEISSFYFDEEKRRCNVRTLYTRPLPTSVGMWKNIPEWIDDLAVQGYVTKKEVDEWKHLVCC